jgi:hypothetical protein
VHPSFKTTTASRQPTEIIRWQIVLGHQKKEDVAEFYMYVI